MTAMKRPILKRALIAVLCVLLALLLVVGGYIAYVLIAYYRIGDKPTDMESVTDQALTVGTAHTVLSWNIGFAAYSRDFSFFMDGGTESRAYSRDEVFKNLDGMLERLLAQQADLMLLQEVDTDATRSYGVDQRAYLGAAFPTYNKTFAQNYDSPYLFYPIFSPHGASKSGLFTLATSGISSANRVELPVEKGLMKFLDLDRCYHKITLPTDNGKTLCLYNLHLSAYTSDGTIATDQIKLLIADMQAEYDRGNYVIAGGDFNKDLRGDNTAICGDENNWAQPFPTALLGTNFSLIADREGAHSCRGCDIGYLPGVTFEVTVDGFIVSKNVTVNSVTTINEGFEHSDHNPVKMSFTLQ